MPIGFLKKGDNWVCTPPFPCRAARQRNLAISSTIGAAKMESDAHQLILNEIFRPSHPSSLIESHASLKSLRLGM